ncbi:MAG: discoidin domain-containing protein [Tannerella sp.]|jgi:hypothetical protein|nr:discoidin domain-containing protein [Tannerella sp.]
MEKTESSKVVTTLTLLPYFAWNNRGDGSMMVWFPETEDIQPYINMQLMTHGKFKDIEASYTSASDILSAIADNQTPETSADNHVYKWTSRGEYGKPQWITITLEKATDIQSISVFWYDDNGRVKVPQSWSLEYWNDGKWNDYPVYITDRYNVFKDQFNMVHPGQPLKTEKIRLSMTPQPESAVGIFEINIENDK